MSGSAEVYYNKVEECSHSNPTAEWEETTLFMQMKKECKEMIGQKLVNDFGKKNSRGGY